MNGPVDISPDHQREVWDILRKNLPPGVAVWVFGSRAKWTTRDSSDLDLALEGDINDNTVTELETAFDESSLPYKVDVIDINQISEGFRRMVKPQMVPFPPPSHVNLNWDGGVLEDVLTLQGGFDLPYDKRVPGPYPVIGPTGQVGSNAEAKVKGPGVVMGMPENPGKPQYVTGDFWPLDTTVWVKNFKKNHPLFCYYLLKTIDVSAYDANKENMNLNHIPVRLPPPTEQCIIARILRTLDDKMELNRRTSQTLEEMARALFKSWFVDFDPVRAKTDGRWRSGESLLGLPAEYYDIFPDRMIDSETGKIPKGWQIKCLKDFVNLNPKPLSQTNHPDSVDLSNMKCRIVGSTRHFSWEHIPGDAKQVLRPGDIIVQPGNHSFTGMGDLAAGAGFAVLRPTHASFREFACLSVMHQGNHRTRRADGAMHLSNLIGETRVAVPILDKNILRCFSNIVGPILGKIEQTMKITHTLASQQNALLSKFMSGEFHTNGSSKTDGI